MGRDGPLRQDGLELIEDTWLGGGGGQGPFLCGRTCTLADLVAACELENLGAPYVEVHFPRHFKLPS